MFNGGSNYEVRDVPKPSIGKPTDAILEVKCALSSGTNKHLFDEPAIEEGRVPGPEFVSQVGSDVTEAKAGDRVVSATMTHFYCERGEWANCTDGGWELG